MYIKVNNFYNDPDTCYQIVKVLSHLNELTVFPIQHGTGHTSEPCKMVITRTHSTELFEHIQ